MPSPACSASATAFQKRPHGFQKRLVETSPTRQSGADVECRTAAAATAAAGQRGWELLRVANADQPRSFEPSHRRDCHSAAPSLSLQQVFQQGCRGVVSKMTVSPTTVRTERVPPCSSARASGCTRPSGRLTCSSAFIIVPSKALGKLITSVATIVAAVSQGPSWTRLSLVRLLGCSWACSILCHFTLHFIVNPNHCQ